MLSSSLADQYCLRCLMIASAYTSDRDDEDATQTAGPCILCAYMQDADLRHENYSFWLFVVRNHRQDSQMRGDCEFNIVAMRTFHAL
jgi:hypothetical protein